tara:strand:+ start:716 stop:1303 length:588 start_codon:yes stop_codon:yes gene_type:complete
MALALYKYDACGYCQRVLRAIADLGLQERIELRDTLVDPRWRKELVGATGRATVPVLRIEDEGEEVRWLPESRDIVAYLYERFGEGKKPPAIETRQIHRVATMAMWALLGAGIFFTEWQPSLWFAACLIGAVRSFHNAWRTRAWFPGAVGVVFLFACAAIALRAQGVMDVPWWYVAYGLVAVLLVATLIVRRRTR